MCNCSQQLAVEGTSECIGDHKLGDLCTKPGQWSIGLANQDSWEHYLVRQAPEGDAGHQLGDLCTKPGC